MMHLQQHIAIEQDLEHTTFQNEEDKAESLDQTMNKVYRAAQFILPPARFSAVKKGTDRVAQEAQCRSFN
jgi:hypothetical protein